MKPRVYAIATLDSKGHELAFVADSIREAGAEAVIVDVSLSGPAQVPPDFPRENVAACHPKGRAYLMGGLGREEAIEAMGSSLGSFLAAEYAAGRLQAAIGMGGSEGTSLIAPALRALPLGIPKVLISTLAGGDTGAYVGTSDLAMFFPVSDIAGLNFLSRRILKNAAYAAAGMAHCAAEAVPGLPAAGITMFGVTTPCVDRVRAGLTAAGWEGVAFHAVGTGGAAMEDLAAQGRFRAILDLTTTEIADARLGGIFPAAPNRFEAIAKHGLPAVVSVGALDMVNFGPKATVPERYRHRLLYAHTPMVTLMRTTPEENRDFGRFLAERLSRGNAPLTVLLPERGISALDAPGKPFFDPEADQALFEALEQAFPRSASRRIVRLPHHINDPAFADAVVAELQGLLR